MRFGCLCLGLAVGLVAEAATAQSETELTVAVYWTRDALFQGISDDLTGSGPLAESGIETTLVAGSDFELPYEVALRESIVDLAIVPLEQALDIEFPIDGFADYLVQPFRLDDGPSASAVLQNVYRDFVLTELGHRDMFGISFVGFGESAIMSPGALESLGDFDGKQVFAFDPDDTTLTTLGALTSQIGLGDLPTALAASAISGDPLAVELTTGFLTQPALGFQEVTQSIVAEYRPIVFAVMIRSETWASFTEAQRIALEVAFDTVETASFERAAEFDAANLARLQDDSDATLVRFASLVSEEAAAGFETSWADQFPESAGRVTSVYDAALQRALPPEPPGPRDVPATPPRLLFATDREAQNTGDVHTEFGVQQSRDARFRCGEITWPSDPQRRRGVPHKAEMQFAGPIQQDDACADLFADAVAIGGRALVYVHGYNNSFADAAGRAISIIEDAGWPRPVIVWSWPSHSMAGAYVPDEQHVDDSRRRFERFLTTLAATDGLSRLDLLAHSMGGRLGVEALYWSEENAPGLLHHATFVAPDVSNNGFVDAVTDAGGRERMTLYASEFDKPLGVSRRFHDQPRAGQGGPHLIVRPGLDTIDAGPVDDEWYQLNHTHAVQSAEGLRDLNRLLVQDMNPDRRQLPFVRRRGKEYWVLERDDDLRSALDGRN